MVGVTGKQTPFQGDRDGHANLPLLLKTELVFSLFLLKLKASCWQPGGLGIISNLLQETWCVMG